jgi:histidinol-phosphate/aromatic aminotransferase/cobyric acid decarboxylase-like protein
MAFEHGGPDERELRALAVDPADLVDFSVNVNPYGPCPEVLAAIRSAPVDRYPDPTALAAREALAASLDVSPDWVVLGNGAADLLWAVRRLVGRALLVEPTFSEFRAGAAPGAVDAQWWARPDDSFAVDLEQIGREVRTAGVDAVYLCNPNNPTGRAVAAAEIAELARELPDCTMVLDESFLSLSDRAHELFVPLPANVVRVRSLTKDHCIPGARVGYVVAVPAVAAALHQARPAWSASAAAQRAAIAAAAQAPFVESCRRRLLRDRDELAASLGGCVVVIPSSAPYLLVRFAAPGAVVRRQLLEHHRILVRDCASFDLPDWVRLAARPAPDRARLLEALRDRGLWASKASDRSDHHRGAICHMGHLATRKPQ